MKKKRRVLLGFLYLFLLVGLFGRVPTTAQAQEWEAESSLVEDVDMKEWNNRIRREKFDLILPQIMRERDVDMWIHVMRIAIPDQFGAEELGSTSGFFVFTDLGCGPLTLMEAYAASPPSHLQRVGKLSRELVLQCSSRIR